MNNINQVFVVDNDPSARNGLVRLLSTTGYNVSSYASTKDFLGSLESNVIGCLVLDADTPGLSGIELLNQLKAFNADLSIIIISSNNDRAIQGKSWQKKADAFFRKPVDGTALIDSIEWALRSKSMNDNNSNVKTE